MAKSGNRVSCRAIITVNAALRERGIPLEPVFSKLPITLEYSEDPGNFTDWDTFVAYLEQIEKALGGAKELEAWTPDVEKLPGNDVLTSLIGYFSTLRAIYWTIAKYSTIQFNQLKSSFENLPDGRIHIRLELDPELRGSPTLFRVWLVGLRPVPRRFNLPDAVIEARISPHCGEYWITLPPERSIWPKAQNIWRAFFARKTAIEQLTQQNRETANYYQKLIETRKLLSEQELKVSLSAQLASLARLSALGEMAGAISHEINNPLMRLNMRIERLKNRIVELPLPEETISSLTQDIGALESVVDRMARVTHGLLAFAGNAEDAPLEVVAVEAVIEETLQLCREKLRVDNIRLIVDEIPEGLSLECRPTQISQVLLNLINNSHDAIRESSDPWIRLDFQKSGQAIEISVIDSGNGIPEPAQKKLFEPFFTTKDFGKGTGLGLSISRGLLESHQGTLTYDPGSPNTRFVIRLPKIRRKKYANAT